MNLESGKVVVESAIKNTEGMFNKKAVKEAVQRFSEYSGEAEKTVNELQTTVTSQSNQILSLNKAGEEAANKLKEAQAQNVYQKGQTDAANEALAESKKEAESTKSKLRESLNRKFVKKEELDEGQIKTTYSKNRTGFQAEVVSKPGNDEVMVEATLGDGATKKKFKFNKTTKKAETIDDTKPAVVSIKTDKTSNGARFVRKEYSNGVTETCYPQGMDGRGCKEIYTTARDGETMLKYESFSADESAKYTRERLGKQHYRHTTDNPTYKEVKVDINDEINGSFFKSYEKEMKETGHKVKFERELDDFGILKPNVNIEITCPKNTSGVSGTIEAISTGGQLSYKNAKATMKDGNEIIFYNFRGQVPQAFRIVNPTTGKTDIIANRQTVEENWVKLGFYFRY